MVSDQPVDFVAKLAELRARKGETPPPVQQPPSEPEWDKSVLLPDLGGNITEEGLELDAFVDNIDIIDAYNKWCRKMVPDAGGKREGIMVSCPNPAHPDKEPSAWINLDKQTYYCGGCNEGGDAHDIAAYAYGLPVPGYKTGDTFHQLRKDMAEAFGFRSKKVPGGTVTWVEPPQGTPPPPPAPPSTGPVPPAVAGPPSLTVVPELDPDGGEIPEDEDVSYMWAEDDGEDELVVYPTIDWQRLIPEDTFIYEYMKATSNDDSPEEYHFWHALMALGLVVGRNVTLDDTRPVYGNLLLCILGATGTGKSRSRGHLDYCLRQVSPFHADGTRTTGVKLVPVPSSGEYLVNAFFYEGKDPSNNKTSLGPQRVNGLVDFDEMSALLARANRQGSTLKSTIMSFADAAMEVKIGGLQRGDFIAHEPFCSITASTQPKAIRTLLSRNDTGSGFLNRWIFAGGKTKQIEVLGGSRSSIRIDLAKAVDELKAVRGWGAIERSLEMEDDAYEAFSKLFRNKIEPTKVKDDTDLLKRIDLIAKKLMLLLTINLRKEKVPLEVVQAVEPLLEYVIECFGILNANIGVTLMQDVMNELQRVILKHQKKTQRGASVRDISRYVVRKNYSLEQIKKALDVMTALDLIELEPKSNNMGRPTLRYRVVGE